jgi:hypothetical protein
MRQMEFSSDEQVKKSYEFLNSLNQPACEGCNHGIRMCYNTPCMGTVEDFEKLIEAGYAGSLMLDHWCGGHMNGNPFKEDVLYLAPAIENKQKQAAPFIRSGKCALLINNKCSLHDLGLKPIQGKSVCCKLERVYKDENGENKAIEERFLILHTWNTQKGLDLIEKWKKEVNFKTESGDEEIDKKDPFLFLSLLVEQIQKFEEIEKKEKTGEMPLYTPLTEPRKIIEYTKPY